MDYQSKEGEVDNEMPGRIQQTIQKKDWKEETAINEYKMTPSARGGRFGKQKLCYLYRY